MNGNIDKAKGRIKQAAGALTNNKRLKAEGKVDEARGTIKNNVDKVAHAIKKNV